MAYKGMLRRDFITGLLIILPLVGTIWILLKAFLILTGFLVAAVRTVHPLDSLSLVVLTRLAALALIAVGLVLMGALARNVFGRRMLRLLEGLCARIPVFNKIYGALRQISEALIGEGKTVFRRVVLVEYPRKGVYAVGFLTSEARGEPQAKTEAEVVNVFVPTTPNPTSGMLTMVPRDEIIPLEMSVEDGMKLVISGGALIPPYGRDS